MNQVNHVTVEEAILLWDCLESMSIVDIIDYDRVKSVNLDGNAPRIVQGYFPLLVREDGIPPYLWTGHFIPSHLCTITLKDFDSEIAQLLEKQRKVQEFVRMHSEKREEVERPLLDEMLNQDEW